MKSLLLEATSSLHQTISVNSIGSQHQIIPMNTELTPVLIHDLQGGDIRGTLHNLIDPFASPHSCIPFLLGHDWDAFVLHDFRVRMDTDH